MHTYTNRCEIYYTWYHRYVHIQNIFVCGYMIYTYKKGIKHIIMQTDSGMIWGDIYQSNLYRFLHFPNSLKEYTTFILKV